ncbi:MAG: hypothetical protein HYU64_21680 [Armatimonadetes bacterium]|nr:hypothetical protein [Armatimonadota bacterium]
MEKLGLAGSYGLKDKALGATTSSTLLSIAPRAAVTAVDAYMGYVTDASISTNQAAAWFMGTVGVMRGIYSICELAGSDCMRSLGTPKHAQKAVGDFLAGCGQLATALGAGPVGIAVTFAGDLVALFGTIQENVE